MPHSVDEAMHRAEQLELQAHDAIPEFRLEEAVGCLREALAIREAIRARHSGSDLDPVTLDQRAGLDTSA